MIFPDDYKCLICKFRYYGCKHSKDKGMLACRHFVPKKFPDVKVSSLALYRCFFGVCPFLLARGLFCGKEYQ